jgi:4-hydroxybenzoate polyprenyltransferase
LKGWRRLWQPRRPLFWLWLAFNALSSAFAWAMRWPGLADGGVLAFGVLALANVAAGLVVLWRLLAGPADDQR